LAKPAGVVGAVGEHGFGGGQGIEHHRGTLVVAGLPCGQAEQDGGPRPSHTA
jgi:hypothetical protein